MAQGTVSPANKVPRRILGTLLSSLSAGVVPRLGAPYIAIGRIEEINALTEALDRVRDGEGATKFIIGRYGSGKSFLIQLARGYALDNGFITADCDLSPERRLAGGELSGLATFRELMKNLACKSSPDGGAMTVILGKWLTGISFALCDEGFERDTPEYEEEFSKRITSVIRSLESNVGGFDFGFVLKRYYEAWRDGDDDMQSACLKWLRGEYSTKTEAKDALKARSISVIGDENWYDYLKLYTQFVREAGYSGLCVYIDECVNLYKIANRISREKNYEKILSMFNDTLQGRAPGLMIVFGGTPQFLEDTRRGLFSYEALKSRLADSRFSSGELRSVMQPVFRLKRLSDSELLALLIRLAALHGEYYKWDVRISTDEMGHFLESALRREGAESMMTPREIIRDFIAVLDILYSNPDKTYADVTAAQQPQRQAAAPAEGPAHGAVTLEDIVF